MKRIVSVLCAAALAAVGAPMTVTAEDGESDFSFTYELKSDGTAVITGSTGGGSILTIPSELDGHTVTAVGPRVFTGLSELDTVIIPETLITVGELSFTGCPALSSFIVDGNNPVLHSIGGSLCSANELIVYAGDSDAFIPDTTRIIRKGAFLGKTELVSAELPDSVSYIGDYAFSGCTSLEEIVIPDGVEAIGSGCFMSCTSLERAVLGSGLDEISADCFYSCTSLHTVSIPESVSAIGSEAFYGCLDLTGLYIPESVIAIADNAIGRHYDLRSGGEENIADFRITGESGSAAEEYAASYGLLFTVGEIPLGDMDGNYGVDARDASAVLTDYANVSTGKATSMTGWQFRVSDFNEDGVTDGRDASAVLTEYVRQQTPMGAQS